MASFERVNERFLTRDVAPGVFMAWQMNTGDEMNNPAHVQPNTWHRPMLPDFIPVEARWVDLVWMFVGGVAPGRNGYMLWVEFRDPQATNLPPGYDWSLTGDKTIYQYYSMHNHREPGAGLHVACHNRQICGRWRITDDYQNPYGFSFWVQGYET